MIKDDRLIQLIKSGEPMDEDDFWEAYSWYIDRVVDDALDHGQVEETFIVELPNNEYYMASCITGDNTEWEVEDTSFYRVKKVCGEWVYYDYNDDEHLVDVLTDYLERHSISELKNNVDKVIHEAEGDFINRSEV